MITHLLAIIWGSVLSFVSLLFLMQPRLLASFFHVFKKTSMRWISAFTTFLVGVVMVFIHNIWVIGWPVSITILGWLTLFKGVDLIFFSHRAQARWNDVSKKRWEMLFLSLFVFGLALLYAGLSGA